MKHVLDKVFKIGPSKIGGIPPLKNFTWSILEYLVPYDKKGWRLYNFSVSKFEQQIV